MMQKRLFCVTINNMIKKSKKYIQCVHNNNKEVTPIQTIHAIKNAGFDGVFLQWFNKDWSFSKWLQIPIINYGIK